MKKIRETLAKVLTYVYAVGILLSLFLGAFSALGYIAAIVLGGDTATKICDFIYKDFYPHIVYLASLSIMIGFARMYVAGEKSLVPPKKKKIESK